MNKVSGKKADFNLLSEDASRIVIGYGLKKVTTKLYEWFEVYIYKTKKNLITLADVKDAIIADINKAIDEKILSGYQWTILHGTDAGKVANVWLSAENQNNYKGFHDAAHDYPEQVEFPAVYKIGEDEDGKALYEHFESIAEVAQFYLGALGFIKQTLAEGWQTKDAIDWTEYEALFPEPEQPSNAEE